MAAYSYLVSRISSEEFIRRRFISSLVARDLMLDAGIDIRYSPPCTHHAIHNAIRKTSGAYTELIGIGPELVQSIMSFPRKREST